MIKEYVQLWYMSMKMIYLGAEMSIAREAPLGLVAPEDSGLIPTAVG